jgi:hypothetical protein
MDRVIDHAYRLENGKIAAIEIRLRVALKRHSRWWASLAMNAQITPLRARSPSSVVDAVSKGRIR